MRLNFLTVLQEVSAMSTLRAKKRNSEIKAKKLRREGFATGVLFGKEMKESIPLQFEETEALRFVKANKEGAQVTLDMGEEQVDASVKNIDYDPMKRQILALDLQALVNGEKISTTVQIKLLNEGSIQGFVGQELTEIHYKADPANLLDTIEIDLSKLDRDIKNMYVKDLELTGKKDVELTTPEDALIFYITDHLKAMDEEEEKDPEETTA